MSVEAEIRRIVREELARAGVLPTEQSPGPVQIDDVARARARGALRRLGVAVPDSAAGRKRT